MATKTPKKYLIEDTVIVDEIYSIVESVAKNKLSSIKSCIERYIQKRHKSLYDYAPVDRIFFKKQDSDDFFKSIGINIKDISAILPKLYYWKDDELQACKDEFSLTLLMLIRYIIKEKPSDKSLTELICMYLSFSGKFYASAHAKWFSQYVPKREVMDYVVNYMLSQKFDLVQTRSVWGAIKNLTTTWLETYSEELKGDITDERISYVIHQLYNRIYAFLRNIAKPYYEAYENKLYLNAESDDYDEENFRIANNNSTVAANITEAVMNYMTSNQVSLALCYNVSSSGVDPYEIKAIFENILNEKKRLADLRYVINILLVDYAAHYPGEKDLTGPKFIAYSITMKPNTKDENILRLKNIVLEWLNTSSRYKRIKTQATKNNYYKAILSYIALTINLANKES